MCFTFHKNLFLSEAATLDIIFVEIAVFSKCPKNHHLVSALQLVGWKKFYFGGYVGKQRRECAS